MDGERFDALTRRFGDTRSRREVLAGISATALASLGLHRFVKPHGALAAGNSTCAHWCHDNFSGNLAGRCTSDAAKGKGICYQCGPAAPANNGLQFCGGICIPVCTPKDQCHVAGICDPATRACTQPAKPNGTLCNDGNACTQIDTCQNGVCIGGTPVQCHPLDDCHVAGTCNPSTGICDNPNAPDGTSCNDRNACTSGDICLAGVCGGGAQIPCTTENPCLVASCDPGQGCVTRSKATGSACDDGNACTGSDACDGGGHCLSGTPVVTCNPCLRCNPATGVCEPDPAQIGLACPSGPNHCFGAYVCSPAGSCVGINPVTCGPADQCHEPGVCDPGSGACVYPDKAEGTPCSDGNLCTTFDHCSAGVCVSSGEIACPTNQTDPCRSTDGFCNPSTGDCEYAPVAYGVSCSTPANFPCTGSICDGNGTCLAGPYLCDGECQSCSFAENICFNTDGAFCHSDKGVCLGGACQSRCGARCPYDACFELLDPGGGTVEGFLCCAGHMDAAGNCCWFNGQFGEAVDGNCVFGVDTSCCSDGTCHDECSFNRIRSCC